MYYFFPSGERLALALENQIISLIFTGDIVQIIICSKVAKDLIGVASN
jgi:hypothetical protein